MVVLERTRSFFYLTADDHHEDKLTSQIFTELIEDTAKHGQTQVLAGWASLLCCTGSQCVSDGVAHLRVTDSMRRSSAAPRLAMPDQSVNELVTLSLNDLRPPLPQPAGPH